MVVLLVGGFSLVANVVVPDARAGCPCEVPDAVEILGLEDSRAPVRQVLPFLDSSDPDTRRRAALAIGRISGPVPEGETAGAAHEALSRSLRTDPDPEVRRAAAFALGLMGTTRAGAALAAQLYRGEETSTLVRAEIVTGLGRTDPTTHPAVFSMALHDPEPRVVQAALLAVWRGSPGLHIDRILALSEATEARTRWCAAYALMRSLGSAPSGRTAIPEPQDLRPSARERVCARLIGLVEDPPAGVLLAEDPSAEDPPAGDPSAEDPSAAIRLQALRGLGRCLAASAPHLPDALGERMIAVLLRNHTHRDARVRVEAVRASAAAGRDAWESASRASSRTGPATAAEPDWLLRALEDSHPHVRVTSIEAAARLLPLPVLLERMHNHLEAPLAWERAAAISAASAACLEAGQYAQVLSLADRGAADPDWAVRYAAADALASLAMEALPVAVPDADDEAMDKQRFREQLGKRLRMVLDDDPKVAKAVVAAWLQLRLRESGHLDTVIEASGHLSGHEDEVLRALTLAGIGECGAGIGDGDAAALLALATRMRPDPSVDVRQALPDLITPVLAGPRRQEAVRFLAALAADDSDRLVRQAALARLRAAQDPDRPYPPEVAGLDPGPVATGRSPRDYERILEEGWRAREAVIRTASGEMRVALFGIAAPLTVYNFVELAEAGYFDEGAWHRVVPDFVIQDGCPRTDGWGGPGHTIRCENNPESYTTGTLGMALSGKDTGGSQFFLTLSDQPHLDGRYTVFGRLTSGDAVMRAVAQGERIESIEIRYHGHEGQ